MVSFCALTILAGPNLFVTGRFINELRNQPDEVVSFNARAEEVGWLHVEVYCLEACLNMITANASAVFTYFSEEPSRCTFCKGRFNAKPWYVDSPRVTLICHLTIY